MAIEILLIVVGIVLVVYGSNILVDGASGVSRRLGISEFVIGLTIVGFGTSCPELVVSLTGALKGSSDIAIGNVVGSNIFNTLLILGLTAVLSPIAITSSNKKRDIPMMLIVTIFFALITLKGVINRVDGVVFLLVFAYVMYLSFKGDASAVQEDESQKQAQSMVLSIVMIIGGLAGLVFGGQLFVDNAVKFAERIGVSEKFIAITLLACGTSLPELATSIVAVAKKKGQFALGNIIGSNLFNVLFILGCSSLIHPLSTGSMGYVDLGVLVISALMMLFAYTGKGNKIGRAPGAAMIAVYIAYIAFLATKL